MKAAPNKTLVITAVLGLIFGIAGTLGVAHAAGLTKKQVKTIATKVVKKQAKSLTVKDSKNLGGKAPSAYQDNVRVYTTTISVPTQNVGLEIPNLVSGRSYQISYSAYLNGAPAGASYCFLARQEANGDAVQDYADDPHTQASPGCAGSAVVTMGPGQKVFFFLGSDVGDWTTQTGPVDPIQVTVEELDSVSTGTLTPVV